MVTTGRRLPRHARQTQSKHVALCDRSAWSGRRLMLSHAVRCTVCGRSGACCRTPTLSCTPLSLASPRRWRLVLMQHPNWVRPNGMPFEVVALPGLDAVAQRRYLASGLLTALLAAPGPRTWVYQDGFDCAAVMFCVHGPSAGHKQSGCLLPGCHLGVSLRALLGITGVRLGKASGRKAAA